MFKNYLMTAIRSLLKNKLHSLVNIGGLGIALSVCLVMFLFVWDEISYDKWLPEVDSLYRAESDLVIPGQTPKHFAAQPGRWKVSVTQYFENEVDAITRIYRDRHRVQKGEDFFNESVVFADKEFSEIFQLEMVRGNLADAFKDNQSIILTEAMASKYFGTSNPMGETLYFEDDDLTFTIVGVMKDLPENTHLEINFLAKFVDERYLSRPWIAENWVSHNTLTYYKFKKGITAQQLDAMMPKYLNSYVDISNMGMGDVKVTDFLTVTFSPVAGLHLNNQGVMKPAGDIMVVYAFTGIAALILLIASINFMNLSTAKSILRAKEIGVRKVMGAERKQIITQFLGEAVLTTFLALIIAVVIATLALPAFNTFMTKVLGLNIFSDPIMMLGLVGLVTVVGLGAGMYPALQLSSYRPSDVLSGNKSQGANQSVLRTFLVTFQFAISIGLIIVTTVIFSQVDYARSLDVGVKKENTLVLFNLNQPDKIPGPETLRTEMLNLPQVTDVAMSNRAIPIEGDNFMKVNLEGTGPEDAMFMDQIKGDYNYLQFYGAKLIAGRFFSPDFQGDLPKAGEEEGKNETRGAIINETAVKKLGLSSPQEALGKTLIFMGAGGGISDGLISGQIVGVVNDMKLRSLREEYEPLVFFVGDRAFRNMNIRFEDGQTKAGTDAVEAAFNKMAPDYTVSGYDLEERLARFYNGDEERALIFAVFAGFALFISSLGLFGLASYSVERRTREIGLRKVHGASLKAIISLLVMQFSRPVMVANIIAWPVAYYFLNEWLQEFAFRISLHPGYFIGAGIIALMIAWLTVGTQAFKVARTNPINALRYE